MTLSTKTTIIILLILVSCNNRKKEVKHYKPSGKVDFIKYFNNDDTLNYYVKYFRDNGSLICEGQKLNDNKSGSWKYYDEKDILQNVEKFSYGLLSDTQIFYHSDGILDRYKILDKPINCFCDTIEYGFKQIAYWRNGKLREINHIENCLFNGKTLLYDSITGRLEEEFYEVNNLKDGLYKKYFTDGSIMSGYYKNNHPIGKWKTTRNDSILSKKLYK